MHYRYVSHFLIACTIATMSPLRTLAASPPSIVLSEVQWGGSSASTADEWIELANRSSKPQNISSWQITGIASQASAITIPEATIVAGQSTYLIANYPQGDSKTTLNVPADLVTSAVSIPNSNIAITLLDASGNVVDALTDSGTPDTGSTAPFASSERDLATDVWHTATATSNLTDSAMYATPGHADFPVAVTPVEIPAPETAPVSELQTLIPENTDTETIEIPANATEGTDPIIENTELVENAPEATIDEEVIDVTDDTNTDAVEQEIITLIAPIASTVVTESVVPVENETDATEEEETTTTTTRTTAINTQTVTRTLDYRALRVSEFVSNPEEGNEWVELWNAGADPLDLSYVELFDASGKKTALSGMLAGNAYMLIEAPVGKLNNDKDSILLKLTDGQTAFSLTYGTTTFPAPKKGFSAGVCADGWHTTLVPSAGTANICPSPSSLNDSSYETTTASAADDAALNSAHSPATTTPSVQGSTTTTTTQASTDHLAPITESIITDAVSTEASVSQKAEEAREASDDPAPASRTTTSKKISSSKSTLLSIPTHLLDEVTSGQVIETTGTVAVAPGLLGKRIAYLNGVQLYFHKATWPVLETGDSVRIQGTWDNENGNRRIKIAQAEDIDILGSEELLPSVLSDISETSLADVLATATGTLVQKDNEAFVFTAENGSTFRIMDKGKTGALGDARAGETYRIVGMRIPLDGVWTLIPRSTEDVTLIPTTTPDGTGGKFSAPTTPQPSTSLGTSTLPPSSSATPIVGGGILASSVGALGYWLVRSRKLSFLFSPS